MIVASMVNGSGMSMQTDIETAFALTTVQSPEQCCFLASVPVQLIARGIQQGQCQHQPVAAGSCQPS